MEQTVTLENTEETIYQPPIKKRCTIATAVINDNDDGTIVTTTPQHPPPPPPSIIIHKRYSNIFDSNAHALVNAVNCVGVMGKGVALAFKKRYPDMFEDYVLRCRRKEVKPGVPYVYHCTINNLFIINFPTKQHWSNPSKLKWIRQGLQRLAEYIPKWHVRSIAIPALGCTNGGLSWENVYPLIVKWMFPLNIPLEIYAPWQ